MCEFQEFFCCNDIVDSLQAQSLGDKLRFNEYVKSQTINDMDFRDRV
jgi:hypothetical protein